MYEYTATIFSVHDGDTLRMSLDLGFDIFRQDMDMRLFGVDAPELKRPDKLGEKSRDALQAWLVAHPSPYVVTTFKDKTEKFGRYLIKTLTANDGHELIADQLLAGYLKKYAGHGPKPVWP